MIAKVIHSRKRPSSSDESYAFQRPIRYLCRKAAAVALINLAGDWSHAAPQMAVAAGLNRRCRQPAYHLVLSWHTTETPSPAAMLSAATHVLAHLQATAHQAVIALHSDRPHPHVHILLNRIHPITGTRLALRHDYAQLELACRRIEHDAGWPADRGRYDVALSEGEPVLVPKPPAHWREKIRLRARGIRPDPAPTRGAEIRTGWPALRDAMVPAALTRIRWALRRATTWQMVHDTLRAHALRYQRHSRGGRIVHQQLDWAMPACHLGSAYALPHMQRRLGPYQPDAALQSAPHGALELAPFMDTLAPAFEDVLQAFNAYHAQRRAHRAARGALVAALADDARLMRLRLAGRRTAFATALRRVSTDLRRQVMRMWDTQNPRPPAPMPAMDRVEAQSPAVRQRRAHRLLYRGRFLTEAQGHPLDHTAMRQAWTLADGLEDPQLCQPLKVFPKNQRDTVRFDEKTSSS